MILPMIIHNQRLCTAFSLIVARSDADGIDVAPVFLNLRMDFRISIDFAGGCLKYFGTGTFGETEHIDRAVNTGFDGLRRILLVVYRTCRTSQIVNLIHFNVERKNHIVADKFKTLVIQQMIDVSSAAGVEIIGADDFISTFKQLFAEP